MTIEERLIRAEVKLERMAYRKVYEGIQHGL